MSLKKTIAILISIIFISSSVIVNAQTTTSTSAKFTFLNEGDVAPFTGTLFSIEATAKLLAEKARTEQECKLKVKYEADILQAKCMRDNDLLRLKMRKSCAYKKLQLMSETMIYCSLVAE